MGNCTFGCSFELRLINQRILPGRSKRIHSRLPRKAKYKPTEELLHTGYRDHYLVDRDFRLYSFSFVPMLPLDPDLVLVQEHFRTLLFKGGKLQASVERKRTQEVLPLFENIHCCLQGSLEYDSTARASVVWTLFKLLLRHTRRPSRRS